MVIICGSIFIIKNLNRTISNLNTNYYQAPWPRIYDNKNETKNLDLSFNKPQKFDYRIKNDVLKSLKLKIDNIGVISGPSFAYEVIKKKPTALVVAGNKNIIK